MAMSRRLLWRSWALRGDDVRLWSRTCPALLRPPAAAAAAAMQQRQAHGFSAKLNPPASTRPPPLMVPSRDSVESTMSYYAQLGRGYLRFYKDGLKAIWTNWKLLREKLASIPARDRPSVLFPPRDVPAAFSRADWVLLWRVRHDLVRMPLFGLMLIVIGEFTALVVIYVYRVVPYTCRIPKQVLTTAERSESRRRSAFEDLEARHLDGALSLDVTPAVARRHILRSLNLASNVWDWVGFMPPGMWLTKGRSRMAFLDGDDRRLVDDGGPLGLEKAELNIACGERGIDTIGKTESQLSGLLSLWLRLTRADNPAERRRRMAVLLLTRPDKWPKQRNYTVPDWEL
ncbi:hypothetical protein XA68_12863 [Ophiocordyceps unilateralis]|uniref:Letm1 RBD domain-containing protein n=1 Tax=Ophiocordyceps unilateralis TaxID=268505 RepID=A0A2A9PNH5_OPHUN|nr:hypothetical protein XA68_12863 [Ophiocordyceps unilateralis]